MAFKFDLSGKVAIVTGARRGIGRSIALALAGAGAKVLVNDIATEELESVAQGIRERGETPERIMPISRQRNRLKA